MEKRVRNNLDEGLKIMQEVINGLQKMLELERLRQLQREASNAKTNH